MPILRKVIKVGTTSRAVILPHDWLEAYRRQHGKDLEEVGLEVSDVILVSPFEDEKTNPASLTTK